MGTNVVIPLGLMVPGNGVEPCTPGERPKVQLVKTKKVAGQCSALVTARILGDRLKDTPAVFEPNSAEPFTDTNSHRPPQSLYNSKTTITLPSKQTQRLHTLTVGTHLCRAFLIFYTMYL